MSNPNRRRPAHPGAPRGTAHRTSSMSYRQLATHRKGVPEHADELRAEQQAYRDRFKGSKNPEVPKPRRSDEVYDGTESPR